MSHVERVVHRSDRGRFLEAFRLRLLQLNVPRVPADQRPERKPCVVMGEDGAETYVFATHNVTVEAHMETGRVTLDGPEFALPYEMFMDRQTLQRARRPRSLGRLIFLGATQAA